MNRLILILFFLLPFAAIAQHKIYLYADKAGPVKRYHFADARDSVYVTLGLDTVRMNGFLFKPVYALKSKLPDGNYELYVDSMLRDKASVAKGRPVGDWEHIDPSAYLGYRVVSRHLGDTVVQYYYSPRRQLLRREWSYTGGDISVLVQYNEDGSVRAHNFYLGKAPHISSRIDDYGTTGRLRSVEDQADKDNPVVRCNTTYTNEGRDRKVRVLYQNDQMLLLWYRQEILVHWEVRVYNKDGYKMLAVYTTDGEVWNGE